jgi:GNAT superfamily N-acetyltransferase
MISMNVRIRSVVPEDLPELLSLCVEHAAFEQSPCVPQDHSNAFERALFGVPPRVHIWLAEIDGVAAGYASAAFEFSTWMAAEYLHLDCLYLREHARNRGVGEMLIEAVGGFALSQGCRAMQWQTPDWNADAARFYRRMGANEVMKRRFSLDLSNEPTCSRCPCSTSVSASSADSTAAVPAVSTR